ncbi:hypothetical protein AB6A40_006824 [Gnathostoma spinigerum]|uniref:4'-phosphopantetheine phosphatase n=1 Tax=Gnathostoma spinigerum TaxID=75299 RepID=A0ABD6EV44_9BILA
MSENKRMIGDALGIEFIEVNEMECLVKGNNFLLINILDEAFTYNHQSSICKYSFETVDSDSAFPYLLVNIGSGVSIYKVESNRQFERIGGSSMGSGCFFGIGGLITGIHDFDALMRMGEEGDHRSVDVLVSDIYGGESDRLGMPPDLIAGSFGKCVDPIITGKVKYDDRYKASAVRSLLLMISNHLGQIAVLYADSVNVDRIYFGGCFTRIHAIAMRTISFAVNFWSLGKRQAYFLRHENYTAAIGAFLDGVERFAPNPSLYIDESFNVSWKEHYAGSTALDRFVPTAPLSSNANIGILEMECCEIVLVRFPLLRRDVVYVPDTVSLNSDPDARDYWFSCMEDAIEKTVLKALESQSRCPDAAQRAAKVRKKYLGHLKMLREKPFAYGCCTVRNLLDLREQILNQYLFDDAFIKQKALENKKAFSELKRLLEEIDSIIDERARQIQVVKGLLTGNIFDWGAREVVRMLENGDLSFRAASNYLQQRPWLVDDLDDWLSSFSEKKYRCAIIFVDNSGVDILLGVLTFARELLKIGTKVIVACNRSPALNDITAIELINVMEQLSEVDEILYTNYKDGGLMVCSTGQGSPCLDLRRIDKSLCQLVVSEGVDLVVIEGMGRSIHTNYDAHFTCDSLKVGRGISRVHCD